jgi:hypothetical protein
MENILIAPLFHISDRYSAEIGIIVGDLLQHDKTQRPSADALLKTPLLQDEMRAMLQGRHKAAAKAVDAPHSHREMYSERPAGWRHRDSGGARAETRAQQDEAAAHVEQQQQCDAPYSARDKPYSARDGLHTARSQIRPLGDHNPRMPGSMRSASPGVAEAAKLLLGGLEQRCREPQDSPHERPRRSSRTPRDSAQGLPGTPRDSPSLRPRVPCNTPSSEVPRAEYPRGSPHCDPSRTPRDSPGVRPRVPCNTPSAELHRAEYLRASTHYDSSRTPRDSPSVRPRVPCNTPSSELQRSEYTPTCLGESSKLRALESRIDAIDRKRSEYRPMCLEESPRLRPRDLQRSEYHPTCLEESPRLGPRDRASTRGTRTRRQAPSQSASPREDVAEALSKLLLGAPTDFAECRW